VFREEHAEVDVEELVAVEREYRPRSRRRVAASRRPPPRPSGSSSPTASTSAPSPEQRLDEGVLVPGPAGHDHACHARVDEPSDHVLGQREAGDKHERLR
jgi:hypothetical protein